MSKSPHSPDELVTQHKERSPVEATGLVVNICLKGNRGRAVLDKEKLGSFFQTHLEHCLPIRESGTVVAIIPLGLLRELYSGQ
jgi:hypothetical protein